MDEAALSFLRRRDASTELTALVGWLSDRCWLNASLLTGFAGFTNASSDRPQSDRGIRVVSLAKREADVALRYGAPKDSELVAQAESAPTEKSSGSYSRARIIHHAPAV